MCRLFMYILRKIHYDMNEEKNMSPIFLYIYKYNEKYDARFHMNN